MIPKEQVIVGAYFENRSGEKVEILKIDAPGPYPVIAYNLDARNVVRLTGGGYYLTPGGGIYLSQPGDLVCPWVTSLVWPEYAPRWANALARDRGVDQWFWYENSKACKVVDVFWVHLNDAGHRRTRDEPGYLFVRAHPSEYPDFTGDWKQSKAVRPKAKVSA